MYLTPSIIRRKCISGLRLLRSKLRFRLVQFRSRRCIPEYRAIDGFLSEAEALALYDMGQCLPRGAVALEIGAWQGKSTYCLARGVSNGTLAVIDPFNAKSGKDVDSETLFQSIVKEQNIDLFDRFQKNMQRGGVDSVIKVYKGYSHQYVGCLPALDLLFIDGDHSIEGCSFDFDEYHKTINPGGYLAFHDYYPDRPDLGSTWVINNKVMPSGNFKNLKVVDSLWIGRRL
jgi:hypothetical protein